MIRIYLDQSIYGNILDEQPADWRIGEIAAILLEAQRSQTGQVWLSPTHVLETAQATDIERRRQLATIMLELTGARRMWWGHEFEAINDFFTFLKLFAPDAIRWPEYFDERALTARQICLGALALLAACPNLSIDSVVEGLALTKAKSQLRHAKFAADPGSWVNEMIETVELGKTTAEPKDEFQGMSMEQIKSAKDEFLAAACKLGNAEMRRLNKHRDTIARAYGAMEIGGLLPTIFTRPMEMSLLFDIPHIVEKWRELQKMVGCGPLPLAIQKADRQQLVSEAALTVVIQHAIYAACRIGLVSTTLSFQTILLDLQKCINKKVIPTGGLLFDAGHAPAMKFCDIFMTTDSDLAESMKTMARFIGDRTQGQFMPQVVTNPKQLLDALRTRRPR